MQKTNKQNTIFLNYLNNKYNFCRTVLMKLHYNSFYQLEIYVINDVLHVFLIIFFLKKTNNCIFF